MEYNYLGYKASAAQVKSLEKVLAGLDPPLSEEEETAVHYLNLKQGNVRSYGDGNTMHSFVAYKNIDSLFAEIESADVERCRRRYQIAVESGIQTLKEAYAVELRLVEDRDFRRRIFDLYKNKVWPALQSSMA